MNMHLGYLKKEFFVIFVSLNILPISTAWSQVVNNNLSKSNGGSNNFDLDDLFIEITIASKRLERPSDAPGVISVISRKEIDHYGGSHLFDVIARLPGFVPGYNPVLPGSLTSMRGQNSSRSSDADIHTLFLLNGRPVREQYSGGVNYGFLQNLPLNLVDHIEVIRGPGSVIYGTNAYSGVINVVTMHPSEVSGVLSFGYGSFNTREFKADWGFGDEDFGIALGLRAEKSDGWELTTQRLVTFNPTNGSINVDGEKTQDLAFDNYGMVLNGHYGNFSLNSFFSSSESKHGGLFAVNANDSLADQFSDYYLIDMGYKFELPEDWSMSVNGSYLRNQLDYFAYIAGASVKLAGRKSDDYLVEASSTGPVGDKVNLLLGLVVNNLTGEGDSFDDYDTFSQSYYFQADYSPWADFKLIAGLQFNKPESVDGHISPRLGAVVHFYENWSAKLLYGVAFRNAYPSEQFPVLPGLYRGNEELEAEIIKTADIQLSYSDPKYYFSFTIFESKASDGIGFINTSSPEFPLTVDNYVELDYLGAELEGYLVLSEQWRLQGSLSYTEHEDEEGNEDLFGQPNGMAKIGLEFDNKEGIRGGLFAIHFIDPAKTTNPLALLINPEPDSFTNVTANIRFDLSYWLGFSERETTITLYADNLLDEDIYQAEPSPGSFYNTLPGYGGRSLYGAFEVSF